MNFHRELKHPDGTLVHWHADEVLDHAHFYHVAHKRKRREAQVASFVVKKLG